MSLQGTQDHRDCSGGHCSHEWPARPRRLSEQPSLRKLGLRWNLKPPGTWQCIWVLKSEPLDNFWRFRKSQGHLWDNLFQKYHDISTLILKDIPCLCRVAINIWIWDYGISHQDSQTFRDLDFLYLSYMILMQIYVLGISQDKSKYPGDIMILSYLGTTLVTEIIPWISYRIHSKAVLSR